MPGKVFVNYRQRNAAGELLPHTLVVEALADRLGAHLGPDLVYLDTTLRPGDPYPAALRARVADAAVLVVVIHAGWLADLAARSHRDRDWVHEEISTAVDTGARLLPVLLEDARLPTREQLPPALRPLADAQAITVRFGSLAEGVAAAVAEIELVVAEDLPDEEHAVAPVPDRGRLVAVLLVLLTCLVVVAVSAVLEAEPFAGLPPELAVAALTSVPLLYLVAGLMTTGCAYAVRRPIAWLEERLAHTEDRAFAVFGLGVLVVVVCLAVVGYVAMSGFGVDGMLVTFVLSVGVLVVPVIRWLRNQERLPDWPRSPVRPTPVWVRKAVVDLERRVETWCAPLPLRHAREARLAVSQIRAALAVVTDPSCATVLGWWRTRSPWITVPHAALASTALVGATVAAALRWAAVGPEPLSGLLWLGGVTAVVGAFCGSVLFEHRRARWHVADLVENTTARLATVEARLAELARPGLVAAHRVRPRRG